MINIRIKLSKQMFKILRQKNKRVHESELSCWLIKGNHYALFTWSTVNIFSRVFMREKPK